MFRKLTFIVILISLISCSPRSYELATGQMVTRHRFERVTRRCDRRLADSAYTERLIRRLYSSAERNSGKKLSPDLEELFSGIDSFEIVYDTGKNY